MTATVDGLSATDHKIRVGASSKNILVLTWAFGILLWSIFTSPHRTSLARNPLLQPFWLLRIWRGDSTWSQDLAFFEILHAVYTYCTGAWSLPSATSLALPEFEDRALRLYKQLFTLLGVCGLGAGVVVFRGEQTKSSNVKSEPLHEQTIDEQLLPPLLIPSRTDHTRLVPKKHSFSYSYLLVGIPVGVHGRISNILSVDSEKQGWFSVSSADHLNRDDGRASLTIKLKQYLHTQGITDRDYAFAYLVTAPRFAGYNFNPVSFWYLYDSDTRLKHMVLEVNNTFDERRMYLLRGVTVGQSVGDDGDKTGGKKLTFSEVWEKDFHVSPFNSRKGTYSLKALDPLAHYEEHGHVRIDNTIVLRSSKESSKIVARVYSDGLPKDPSTISTIEFAKFIASWWWVGFATFPRIVWEAGKLFFQRKLYVWYRPEVAVSSVGRAYTTDERLLEAYFKVFLTRTVAESTKPLRVIYEPAHSQGAEIVMYSPGFTYEEDHQRTITLKVLSPAFYSRFVHYAHAQEAFDRECLATDEKNRTLSIERPELLPILLAAIQQWRQNTTKKQHKLGFLENIRWSCFQRLRCPPAIASYLTTTTSDSDDDYRITDIRSFKPSELDDFVLHNCDDADLYCRTASKLFLAERFAFGFPPLLVGLDFLIRGTLLLTSILHANRCRTVDILRPREFDKADLWTLGTTILLANAVHMWSFLKG